MFYPEVHPVVDTSSQANIIPDHEHLHPPRTSYWQTLLKTLHLQLFASALRKVFEIPLLRKGFRKLIPSGIRQTLSVTSAKKLFIGPEEKKIPLQQNRLSAIIKCSIHVLPLAAALLLVIFNLKQYYIGGELAGTSGQDTEKLAGLQFAAKLHELLMIASLGVIVFTKVRQELVSIRGLPYGAVFAACQIDSIATLWSMEFWAMIFDAWEHKKGHAKTQKWFLVALVAVCVILGVSVGPSTAVLMRPRLDNWPSGGSTFYIGATVDDLIPTTISASSSLSHCLEDTGDPACPYGDWASIAQGYLSFDKALAPLGDMPLILNLASTYSIPQMSLRQRSDGNGNQLWPSAFTLATAPYFAVSDGLAEVGRLWALAAANAPNRARFRYRQDVTYSVDTVQPLVMVYCNDAVLPLTNFTPTLENITLDFPDLGSLSGSAYANGAAGSATYNGGLVFESATTRQQVLDLILSGNPDLLWIDDSNLLNGTSSTLWVVATLPVGVAQGPSFYCCSIDSRQANVTMQATRNQPKLVTGTPDSWYLTGTYNDAWEKVFPSAAWAAYLNPLTSTGGGPNTSNSSKIPLFGSLVESALPADVDIPLIIESTLATMLANGLARSSYNTSMIGTLNGYNDSDPAWEEAFMPKQALGFGGDPWNITEAQRAGATQFTMMAEALGYAYARQGAAQIAAIAVLLVYILLALSHMVYSLNTGNTSTAWDSSPEIAALALNSERTRQMPNTGAGIAHVDTFKEPVWIRATTDGRLQFVLADTRHGPHERRLVVGKEYA